MITLVTVLSPLSFLAQSDVVVQEGTGITIRGQILLPGGKPAIGANLIAADALHTSMAHLKGGEFSWMHECASAETDAEGRFALRLPDRRAMILVAHREGAARFHLKELKLSDQIRLEPWATLQGSLRVGKAPGAQERVSISYERPKDQKAFWIDIGYGGRLLTDDKGHFGCDRLLPGSVRVARMVRQGEGRWGLTNMRTVELAPGKTTDVVLGGTGRPVVGRIALPRNAEDRIDLARGSGSLLVSIPPKDLRPYEEMINSDKRAFLKQWWSSPEAKEAQRKRRQYSFRVGPDGKFRVEDVEPGWYNLWISITEPQVTAGGKGQLELASAKHKLRVPPMPVKQNDEPLDIGTIELSVYKQLKVGDSAPDFAAKTSGRESLSLDDYSGRFVLLCFWDTSGPNSVVMPILRKINAAYAGDRRLALVLLNTDSFTDTAYVYAKQKKLAGIHGYLGRDSQTQSDYGANETPSTFLIDPARKIVARWVQDGSLTDIDAVLQRVLPQRK